MRAFDLIRLGGLAAIWGASFLLLRITAPALGAIATAEARVLLAALILIAWLRLAGIDLAWRAYWRSYLILGIFQAAAPFTLWAFGALHLPASYLVVLNATS